MQQPQQPPETRFDLDPSQFPTPNPDAPTPSNGWRLQPGRPPSGHNIALPDDPAAAALLAAFDGLKLAPAARPNLYVPGFDILRELGGGGMGVVYLARQVGTDRTVALKVLRSGAFASGAVLARFAEEARIVARLRHRDIVQLYEFGEADGLPYLSLEFIPGPTLARVAGGRPQNPRAAARVVDRVARAVQYAHEQGIVHRDLKPANILLQVVGRRPGGDELGVPPPGDSATVFDIGQAAVAPKVADFGLAKILGDEQVRTDTGLAAGTPGYMAPEQATGDRARLGPWTDVFALGVVLYELLSGKLPFPGDTPAALLLAPVNRSPTPLHSYRKGLPRDLETICMKCLARQPEDRYLTAAALADDLQRFLDVRPVAARRAGAAEWFWRLVRRSPAATGLSVALLVALVGGLLTSTALYLRADKRRQEIEQEHAAAVAARNQADDAHAEAKIAADRATAAEEAAAEDRERLAAINRFVMEDILHAVQPSAAVTGGAGADVNLRAAVRAAGATIDVRFKNNPYLMAVMDHTVGVALRDLGEYDTALDHLTRAADTLAGVRPPCDRLLLGARADTAVCLGYAGRYQEALDRLAAVTTALAGCPDAPPDLRLTVRLAKARTLAGLGRFAEAQEEVGQVVEAHEAADGLNHPRTVAALCVLSGVHRAAGHLGEAESVAREAVARATTAGGDRPTAPFAQATAALADAILADQPRTQWARKDELLAAGRTALDAATAAYGAGHPETLQRVANQAAALVAVRRPAEAAQLLSSGVADAKTRFGPDHPRTVRLQIDQAAALAADGRLPAAAAVLEPALALSLARHGPTHANTVSLASQLATLRSPQAGVAPAVIPWVE